MLLMLYTFIEGEEIPDDAKQDTWNLLHAYTDVHIQRLIDKYPGDGVKAITRLQSQCENMNFASKSRYNRQFQQVVHK